MTALTSWVLDHKKTVISLWLAIAVAAFAAIGPANNSLSQQFSVPGEEGYETNRQLAAVYGNGGDVAPLVPVVTLRHGKTVDSPGITGELDAALSKVEAALPDARTASYASTRDRAFVSEDGRTTFALVYIPGKGGVDPGQAEASRHRPRSRTPPSGAPPSRSPGSTPCAPPPATTTQEAPASCWRRSWGRSGRS